MSQPKPDQGMARTLAQDAKDKLIGVVNEALYQHGRQYDHLGLSVNILLHVDPITESAMFFDEPDPVAGVTEEDVARDGSPVPFTTWLAWRVLRDSLAAVSEFMVKEHVEPKETPGALWAPGRN